MASSLAMATLFGSASSPVQTSRISCDPAYVSRCLPDALRCAQTIRKRSRVQLCAYGVDAPLRASQRVTRASVRDPA